MVDELVTTALIASAAAGAGSTATQVIANTYTVAGDKFIGDKVMGNKIGTQVNNYNSAPELSSIQNEDARRLVPLLNELFAISDIDSL